jgi:hypothetical protein
MYLIKDRRLGRDYFIFTQEDPRKEGYKGDVVDGVILDYDMNAIHLWPDGEPRPEPRLGRDPTNQRHYKVFKFPHELQAAGFELVDYNTPILAYSWEDYREMFPVPAELAKTLGQSEWFDYLDEIDEAAKLRQKQNPEPEPPLGSDRDLIAEWVAKRHLSADGSLRQIVYLPTGAPPNEIRLLEINERLTRPENTLEPIDFSIDVAGKAMRLSVADLTGEQFEQLRRNPANLPPGWSLEKLRFWGRRR